MPTNVQLVRNIVLCLTVLFTSCIQSVAEPIRITVRFDQPAGNFRPLHGINKGSIAHGGTIDLTASHRELGIPFVRLHDCQWPYPDVVDVHSVFRDFEADPEEPASYDFRLTDEYLAAVHRSGARMVYRLGESIEHMEAKRFVHPPADPAQWAAICAGIIRHYNESWANGFEYGISYWEIWNEPDNRPAMWTGTDDQFLQLYEVAAVELKRRFPSIKIGGPGFGFTGTLEDGVLKPSEFLLKFLKRCVDRRVPLDFFSWHCYTDDVEELVARAKGVRALLDAYGFSRTESHLNEWNYLPGRSWDSMSKAATPEVRRKFYRRMGGPEGAAFVLAALLRLQEAPVDMCNFFHGEIGGFGLFDEFGGRMQVSIAFEVFNDFVKLGLTRVFVAQELSSGVVVGAGRESRSGRGYVLLVNTDDQVRSVALELLKLDVVRHEFVDLNVLDNERVKKKVALENGTLSFQLQPNSFRLLQLSE